MKSLETYREQARREQVSLRTLLKTLDDDMETSTLMDPTDLFKYIKGTFVPNGNWEISYPESDVEWFQIFKMSASLDGFWLPQKFRSWLKNIETSGQLTTGTQFQSFRKMFMDKPGFVTPRDGRNRTTMACKSGSLRDLIEAYYGNAVKSSDGRLRLWPKIEQHLSARYRNSEDKAQLLKKMKFLFTRCSMTRFGNDANRLCFRRIQMGVKSSVRPAYFVRGVAKFSNGKEGYWNGKGLTLPDGVPKLAKFIASEKAETEEDAMLEFFFHCKTYKLLDNLELMMAEHKCVDVDKTMESMRNQIEDANDLAPQGHDFQDKILAWYNPTTSDEDAEEDDRIPIVENKDGQKIEALTKALASKQNLSTISSGPLKLAFRPEIGDLKKPVLKKSPKSGT